MGVEEVVSLTNITESYVLMLGAYASQHEEAHWVEATQKG